MQHVLDKACHARNGWTLARHTHFTLKPPLPPAQIETSYKGLSMEQEGTRQHVDTMAHAVEQVCSALELLVTTGLVDQVPFCR